jgi:hypothetical protein
MQSAFAVLYCHLRPVRLYHIFSHYLTSGTIFVGKSGFYNIRYELWFSLQILLEKYLILRWIQWDTIRYYIDIHVGYLYPGHILVQFELSQQSFEKISNIKFHENPWSWSRVFACWWTDGRSYRQTDMKKLKVAYFKFANATKKDVNLILSINENNIDMQHYSISTVLYLGTALLRHQVLSLNTTDNVTKTMRRLCVTIVVVEIQWVIHILCVCVCVCVCVLLS